VRFVSLFLALACATVAVARTRSVRSDELPLRNARSIVWVGAHPDDEVVVAPILAPLCRDGSARCTFIVLTHGGSGDVRADEERASASYFNAQLTHLDNPDGGADRWDADALKQTIATIIKNAGADLVITFDPRHGSSCHPDHRKTAEIVLDAVKDIEIDLLETRIIYDAQPFAIHFTPAGSATDGVVRFTASDSAWQSMIDVMRLHPSQFDQSWIDAIESIPEIDRAVFLARSDVALRAASNIAGCP